MFLNKKQFVIDNNRYINNINFIKELIKVDKENLVVIESLIETYEFLLEVETDYLKKKRAKQQLTYYYKRKQSLKASIDMSEYEISFIREKIFTVG